MREEKQLQWTENCSRTAVTAMLSLPPQWPVTRKVGTSTRKDIHVLCYQHHTEMFVRPASGAAEDLRYACQEPGCLIRYDGSRGYFIETKDANILGVEVTPRVNCSNDGQHMYLAEVTPERRNFRLWKCPECSQSCLNNEDTSPGLGKEMGA